MRSLLIPRSSVFSHTVRAPFRPASLALPAQEQIGRRWASTSGQPRQSWSRLEWGHLALLGGVSLILATYVPFDWSSINNLTGHGNSFDQLEDDDDDNEPSPAIEAREGMISFAEVQKHNSPENGIWVILNGEVWDLTEFLPRHPGGTSVLLKNAGKDASDIFNPIHPSNVIEKMLDPSNKVGDIDPKTLPKKKFSKEEKDRLRRLNNLPELSTILNLDDFERVASTILTPQGWGYYRSGSDDEVTYHSNRTSWGRLWFRPRILASVGQVNTATTILSTRPEEEQLKLATPFYISPAAAAKLGHPGGEINLTKAAGEAGVLQGISYHSSCSLDEILAARKEGQPVFYQMYLNTDRDSSAAILKNVEANGVNAVMFTVDSVVLGNRERDARAQGKGAETFMGQSSSGFGIHDPNLSWDDVKWFKKQLNIPLYLKGVQSVEDVARAAEAGVDGVVLSNHGGRSLEYSPSSVDVLIELREKRPELFNALDVFVDGGVRRGTDVLKAVALGAKAVGLGRSFLFANAGYGQAGVTHAVCLLQSEIERSMRLLGVRSMDELTPEMVDILPRVYAYQGAPPPQHQC